LFSAWACGSSSGDAPNTGTYDAAIPPPPPGDEPIPEDETPPPPVIPPCDYSQGFTDIQALATLNTQFDERMMALSPDEKTLYYVSNLTRVAGADAGAKNWSLYRSTRDSTTAPFPTSLLVADPINQPGKSLGSPSLPGDLSIMYLTVAGTGADAGAPLIALATKLGSKYNAPAPATDLPATLHEPFISADNNTLYVAHGSGTGSGTTATNIATVGKDTNGDFQAPADIVEFKHDKPYVDSAPVVSEDELMMVFASSRPPAPSADARQLWVATRAKATDKWGVPTNLVDLNDTSDTAPSFISSDKCRLYLWRATLDDNGKPGPADLFVAKRPAAPDPTQ